MNIKKYLKETLKYALRSKFVIWKYIREVEDYYQMVPDELKSYNEKRFVELFQNAYDNSPFYHRLYSEAGIQRNDIKKMDDIKKLPVVTKEMVKTHGNDMLTVPKWKLLRNHTSGTTGTPLMVYEDWPSIWREQAYLYCYRKRCGYIYGQPLVSLRGNLDKSDTHLKVHISNTLYLSSYNINENTSKLYFMLIKKHKPVAIEGYPSSLYSLALLLRDKHLELHIPVTFTSSETLLDYQRSLIEKQFNTIVYDHFGTTERTISLNESLNHNGYYEDPGYSINEYTEDGELTTSLINKSFPLIRYQGNDVMELKDYMDGNIRLQVKSIQGRKSSCLVGKDGSRYSSALLTRVFKDIVTIDEAQFVQKEKGKVTLNIVTRPDFCKNDMDTLKAAVEYQLGVSNFDIEISLVSKKDIIYSDRGKFSYVLNLMPVAWEG